MHLRQMQISQTVRAYLTLMRLPYILVLSLLCVLFIVTFQKGLYDPALIGLAVICVTFTSAGSAAINDYCDRDSDVLTHPERPISANQISPTRAAQFSGLTFLVALDASLMINPVAFGIVGLNVVLFILYARVIKRLSGFVSNLVMGYLGATIVLFSGAAVFQTINAASLSFVGLIAGGAIGLNVLKDILTLEGDLKAGYPTIAAKRGIRVAAIFGALFLLLSTITSPLPFFVGVVSVAYLFPITVWGGAAVVVSLTLLKASNTESVVKRLKIFTTYWPYVVGIASVAYILPFAIWGPRNMAESSSTRRVTEKMDPGKAQHNDNLKLYLKQIGAIFDIAKIVGEFHDVQHVVNYYRTTKFPLLLVYDRNGFYHYGISYDGKYKTDDLKESPRLVEKYIHDIDAKNVLELAYGRGTNTAFLARRNPHITFDAVDISNKPLRSCAAFLTIHMTPPLSSRR